jgi:hypothetical protein
MEVQQFHGRQARLGRLANGSWLVLKKPSARLSLSKLSKPIAQTIARRSTALEKAGKPGLPLRPADSSTKPKVTGSNPVGRALRTDQFARKCREFRV